MKFESVDFIVSDNIISLVFIFVVKETRKHRIGVGHTQLCFEWNKINSKYKKKTAETTEKFNLTRKEEKKPPKNPSKHK